MTAYTPLEFVVLFIVLPISILRALELCINLEFWIATKLKQWKKSAKNSCRNNLWNNRRRRATVSFCVQCGADLHQQTAYALERVHPLCISCYVSRAREIEARGTLGTNSTEVICQACMRANNRGNNECWHCGYALKGSE